MIKSGIYKITNLVNNKFYIGSAVDLNKRNRQHFNSLNRSDHPNDKLQRFFNKYGLENFKFEVIEFIENKENLIPREQYYLDTLLFAQEFINNKDKRFNRLGLNIHPIAGSPLGFKHTDKTKDKIRKSNTGKKHSEETKLKISKGNKGRKQSEENKRMLYIAHKGKIVSESTREKLRKTNLGKKHSIETKLKIGDLSRGLKRSDETKLKMSLAQKGRKQSEEMREKISKKVLQLDLKTNEIIKEWVSISEAQRILGIGHISKVCKGDRKSCAGFNWQYKV